MKIKNYLSIKQFCSKFYCEFYAVTDYSTFYIRLANQYPLLSHQLSHESCQTLIRATKNLVSANTIFTLIQTMNLVFIEFLLINASDKWNFSRRYPQTIYLCYYSVLKKIILLTDGCLHWCNKFRFKKLQNRKTTITSLAPENQTLRPGDGMRIKNQRLALYKQPEINPHTRGDTKILGGNIYHSTSLLCIFFSHR